MTLAELERAFASRRRKTQLQAKESAARDYLLADLIGRSVARIYSSNAKLPEIHEIYKGVFDTEELEEKQQEKKAEIFALKLKQYANLHNKKYKGGGNS